MTETGGIRLCLAGSCLQWMAELTAAAQEELLDALTSVPFVAHNATYENSFMEMSVKGYAEAVKSGKV